MAAEIEKCVEQLVLDDIIKAGLGLPKAEIFYGQLRKAISEVGESETSLWQRVSKEMLTPSHPHSLHQLMYYSIYKNWVISEKGPPLAWFPTQESARQTNLGRIMEAYGSELLGPSYYNPIISYPYFLRFSIEHPEVYWSIILKELGINFREKPRCILDTSDKLRPGGTWFPGAVLNIAEICLAPMESRNKRDDSIAIVWRDEGHDESAVNYMTLTELRQHVMRVANALNAVFKKGDAIAIDMPMTLNAVVIYLALVLAGYIVVSIADSFVSSEIATRLRISKAKGIFTQDFILRGNKKIPLYSRVIEAGAAKAIVIPMKDKRLGVKLREQDISWSNFLSLADRCDRPEYYLAVQQPIEAVTNILFSSGTTGEPKAIPWTHLQPIRAAAESWGNTDIRVGDIYCWPTNLGWMMGPLLIYSCFLNGATLALYHGSPLGRSFGKFIQDAGVTVLGTVPSMVKTWKNTGCMEDLDWSRIRLFASTGEASSVDDDLWLSSRGWYKPVFECCGGTELSCGYLHGCLLQSQAFGAFSTPTMTTEFFILDGQGIPYPNDQPCIGEIALIPIFMGASDTLLNADHDMVYYKGMPVFRGMQLRRHGDLIERMVGGYYKVHGRCDDTMNLGGIKTSAVEIENVCNQAHQGILETAAVSTPSAGSGPEQLVIFAVLKTGVDIRLDTLKAAFSKAIQNNLNPLFKVSYVKIVPEFPRTASNKLMRRILRDQIKQEISVPRSKL